MKQVALFVFAIVVGLSPTLKIVEAQTGDDAPTPEPTIPVEQPGEEDIPLIHVVLEGENLFTIAEAYGTTIETLQLLNDIDDPSLVYVGQEILIPGGGGTIAATLHVIQVGDTLPGLAADYNTTMEAIADTNRIIHPNYLTAGTSLAILSRTGSTAPQPLTGELYFVQPGDTLTTVAAKYNLSPDLIAASNRLDYPAYLFPGQRLRLPGDKPYQYLSGPWKQVRVHPSTILQGSTAALYIESQLPGEPAGTIGDQPLHFAPYQDGYVAIFGVDAFTEPGVYPLVLSGSGEEGWGQFEQNVMIESAGFGTQFITIPEDISYLLEPRIRADEDAFLTTIYTQFSQTPLWEGLFQVPITNTLISAPYGDSRSYNEGPIEIYHTGIDFVGPVGTPIYAPAAGTVIFSDTLELRGNTLILDHGLGVMTGYYHLSKIHVAVGEMVTAGQLIAEGGSTGLSNGPHLHWDLRVMDVPVDPAFWTLEPFP